MHLPYLGSHNAQCLVLYDPLEFAVLPLQSLKLSKCRLTHSRVAFTPFVDRLNTDPVRSTYSSDARPFIKILLNLQNLILAISLTAKFLILHFQKTNPTYTKWSAYETKLVNN